VFRHFYFFLLFVTTCVALGRQSMVHLWSASLNLNRQPASHPAYFRLCFVVVICRRWQWSQ